MFTKNNGLQRYEKVWSVEFEVFLALHKKTGRILFPPVYFSVRFQWANVTRPYDYSVTSA